MESVASRTGFFVSIDKFTEQYILHVVTSVDLAPSKEGLGPVRRFLHEWKSGLPRYRDNQCRFDGAGKRSN